MERVEPIRDYEKIKFMKAILQKNPRDLLMFELGIHSGLRIGDILAMRVRDVIDARGRPLDHFDLREQKTNKKKRVWYHDDVKKTIWSYLKGYRGDKNRPLFVSQKKAKDGSPIPIRREQAWKILKRAALEANIRDPIGTHSLRKTFGYHWVRTGNSIHALQKYFNHYDERITLDYIGITQDELEEGILNLNFE